MAVLQRGFNYKPIIAPYAPAPVDIYRESLDERSKVYDRNLAEMDQLDILASNMKLLGPDEKLKQDAINQIRLGLAQIGESGAENSTDHVRRLAREFAANTDLQKAGDMYNLEKQRQEDIRQLRLKGLTPYDFTPEYKGVGESPDWTPKVETANDVLADAKNYVGSIKDRMSDLGISFRQSQQPDGSVITYAVTGDGKVVSNEMLESRVGDVIDEFMQSPTGGEQYSRWIGHNGQDPREAARQMLLTAGLSQVGAQVDKKYQIVDKDTSARDAAMAQQQYAQLDPSFEIGDRTGASAYNINPAPYGEKGSFFNFDKTKLRIKSSIPQEGIPYSARHNPEQTSYKSKYNNEAIRSDVEKDIKRAIRISNPNLSETNVDKTFDQFVSDSQFILDNPKVEKLMNDYEESINGINMHIPLMNVGTLHQMERMVDKNFSSENIVKDISNSMEQKVFFTLDDNGNVIPFTEEMREAKKAKQADPSYNFNIDFAGVASEANPFNNKDEYNVNPSETFYQPYALNVNIDGETRTVYASRSLNDRPYGTTKSKETLMKGQEIHNKAMNNIGEFVDFNMKEFEQPLQVRAIPNGQGGVEYQIQGSEEIGGKTYNFKTVPMAGPSDAIKEFKAMVTKKAQEVIANQ